MRTPFSVALGMLLTTLGTNAIAQQITYDGSTGAGKATLEAGNFLGLDALPWLGISATDQGLVYRAGGNTVITGADLVVNYTSATTPTFMIGGYSNTSGQEVTGNRVTLTQGSVNGSVLGGLSQMTYITAPIDTTALVGSADTSGDTSINLNGRQASANRNTVLIHSTGGITGNIYGGHATIWAQTGEVKTGNVGSISTANIFTSASTLGNLGSATVTANGNEVTLANSATVGGAIYGGYAQVKVQTGDATSGSATSNYGVHGSAYTYTSLSNLNLSASDNNKVTIGDNTAVGGAVHGGYAQISAQAGNASSGNGIGAANANTMTSTHSTVSNSTVIASGNNVAVGNNSTISGAIYGGYAQITAQAGNAISGNATSGNAYVTSGYKAEARAVGNGNISNSTASANDNKVTIGDNTAVGGAVYGGYAGLKAAAATTTSGTTTATEPGVNMMNNASGRVSTQNAEVLANDNTVRFDGTLQNGSIYGGYVAFNITQGTATGATGTSINDNSIILSGTLAQATGNTVTIGDNARFPSNTGSLYGGYLDQTMTIHDPSTVTGALAYDVFTGNTLNWSAKAPATFQTVGNFEHYNFTLNPTYANTSTALISAQDIILGANPSNTSDGSTTPSKITVVGIHSGKILNAGDEFILMQATASMTGDADGTTTNITQAQQGISLLYDVQTTLDTGNKQARATILGCQTGAGDTCPTDNNPGNGGERYGNGGSNNATPAARVNPQLKALSEGYLFASQLITRGADTIAYDTFNTINHQNNQNGWTPFALLSGQHNRYNSGSHIKSNDYLLTAGLSYQQHNLTAGAFLEAGWGSYDTYNSFYNAASVHGDGNSRYYGLGLLGHYDFNNGFYTDASLRFGRNHNKFNTTDIQNLATGQFASYDLKSSYVSAHIGTGYIIQLNHNNQLDISAKYLYTTLAGKDANIAGDNIHFNRVDSHRARLNATLNHQYSETLTLNAGLSYEHEFDGKATATTYGIYNIEAPSVRGGTGIVSIGANITPTANQRLTLDIKANGYGGKREGVGASIRINYAF